MEKEKKTVRLGDLLTEKEIEKCVYLWKIERKEELREYLDGMKDELEKKGANSGYLYYMLEYMLGNVRKKGK